MWWSEKTFCGKSWITEKDASELLIARMFALEKPFLIIHGRLVSFLAGLCTTILPKLTGSRRQIRFKANTGWKMANKKAVQVMGKKTETFYIIHSSYSHSFPFCSIEKPENIKVLSCSNQRLILTNLIQLFFKMSKSGKTWTISNQSRGRLRYLSLPPCAPGITLPH